MYEGEDALVALYEPSAAEAISSITLEIDYLSRNSTMNAEKTIDYEEFCGYFVRAFKDFVLASQQPMVIAYAGTKLAVHVQSVELIDVQSMNAAAKGVRGVFGAQSVVRLTAARGSLLRIAGSAAAGANTALLAPSFRFEDLGIGGLDDEFKSIFRRAFASRIFPASIVEKMGIRHVKGIILHGPPGTGKTLMARQIGRMLNAHEPIKVNGPEILNKYVGQSEENVRKLFSAAEAEYRERGDDSQLHIVIFDEIDAICKQRGSRPDATGVGDTVVNQLLAKLDGVDQLNNILVIGMTNRLDLLDDALLRPGRFEVHIEIGLPDEAGRRQIFAIHTAKMQQNELLAADVNLDALAARAKNFSGAEITGLINSAASFAFNRHVKVESGARVAPDAADLRVGMRDFDAAFGEVRAAFGRSDADFEGCAAYGLIPFDARIADILHGGALMVSQLASSSRTRIASLLLYGPNGAGTTALAARIAAASAFPFVKRIAADSMVGFSEAGKAASIAKVFADAHKSPFSVVVVDAIERLLEFVPIGPRFSNLILQTLAVLVRKSPPSGHKLLIVGTTARRTLLEDMDFAAAFDRHSAVPSISSVEALVCVLAALEGVLTAEEVAAIRSRILAEGVSFDIGVKHVINAAEMCVQEKRPEERVEMFVELLLAHGVSAS